MNPNAAKWDDLKMFLEVARHGSVHAAAKRLRLDHSTVCRRIGRLESLLAVKLFDRSRKGIAVRSEAQGLLKHIEQMDRHAGHLEDAFLRGKSTTTQVVRIATMEGIASGYLARRLPALAQFGPNVKIELVSIPQAVDLSRKEADVFLSFFNPDARGLKSTLFGTFSLFLYCSKDYLRRHGAPRTREDLDAHVFVGYIDDLLTINAVRWLDEVVTAPDVSFHSNSVFAQCNAAVSGLGIALLPTFVGEGVAGLQRILLENVSVQREVWVSVRTEQSHLSRIKAATQFLKHIFAHDVDFLLGKTSRLPAL
ncbi:MAG TPA: LysR family transcriptional regulator [Pseudolabrys sp.]|jgi:DNA-binding transcriptional LysR family regulator|nr:LysR family transcriptional regulator [Pseudolabrys sp.]